MNNTVTINPSVSPEECGIVAFPLLNQAKFMAEYGMVNCSVILFNAAWSFIEQEPDPRTLGHLKECAQPVLLKIIESCKKENKLPSSLGLVSIH